MGVEMIVIFGILVLGMLAVSMMHKYYEKLRLPEAHPDYKLRYSAPGSEAQILQALSDGENPDGMFGFYQEDTQTLVIGCTRLGSRKSYRVQIKEKGEHCILTLTLETFTGGARKVNVDAFMAARLKAKPVDGKSK